MELSRRDHSSATARPYRLFAQHSAYALVAWDAFGVLVTGFACRSLNPAAHADQTVRAMLVIIATAGLSVLLLQAHGFYNSQAEPRRMTLLFTLAQSFALMLLALLVWEGFAAIWSGPASAAPDAILVSNRNWLFSWSVTAPLLILLTHPNVEAAIVRANSPAPLRRAVLIADRAGLARLDPVIFSAKLLQLRGVLEIAPRSGIHQSDTRAAPGPALSRLRDVRAVMMRGDADLLLIALPEAAGRRIAAIDRLMAGVAADIWLAPPDTARFYTADTRLSMLGGFPFLPLRQKPIAGVQALIKRAEDLALGLPLLVLAAPAMLLIALAVRLSSPGPAWFIQPRLGLNRRIIMVRKFRTMRIEATDPRGVRQVVRGDARVTGLGRFLRRTSLDELPQLLNVAEGTMSLVGPRPHALGTEAGDLPFGEVAPDYAARHRVKPGMTGWAQVRGWRGETTKAETLRQRIAHDLFYIAHWSLWFDLRILALTIRAVTKGEGA